MTSPSEPLDYPTLQRAVEDARQIISGARGPVTVPAMALQVHVERDFARSGVNLHMRATTGPYDGMAVIENVTWRQVRPGEEAPNNPFWIDERQARMLAEQLNEFNPEIRRAQQARERLDQAQNEMRSLANQLEEVRSHNATLVRVNQEQQRQVRWLERELRDANLERRAAD